MGFGGYSKEAWPPFGVNVLQEVYNFFSFFHTNLRKLIPSKGIYFTTYEYSCRYFTPPGKRRKDVSAWAIALSGSLAGYVYWISCYPFDILKTKMQGDNIRTLEIVSGRRKTRDGEVYLMAWPRV